MGRSSGTRRPGEAPLRWRLAETDEAGALFPDETAAERHVGRGEFAGTEFLHVNARRIINGVPAASRMPFHYTINAYRGCSHACRYCFARPTHEYLGLGIGEDFERKIVVKVNAVERLRAELRAPGWGGDRIAMGTNTDPYQHAEGKYHLTRGIIEVLGEAANPFSILTKSTLVLRDLGPLAAAARRAPVQVDLSIGTLDREVWRLTEPGTPPPERRIDAVRRLNEAGIRSGVLVAPVLPGLSDREDQVKEVIEASRDAGAVSVTVIPLHLRPGVKQHYLDWLSEVRPDLVALHEARFGRGSYQPPAEGARLAALAAAVERHPTSAGRTRGPGDEATGPAGEASGPAASPVRRGPSPTAAHRPRRPLEDTVETERADHQQLRLL
ncbi:MAG TPA: radical SAM protein [Acidimicrobiales bacterium]